MASRNAGWNVTASKGSAPAVAEQAGLAGKQHIIYALSANFSAAPSAPVICQIIDPDVSPNTVYWDGYVPVTNDGEWTFPGGIAIREGASVAAVLSANGSLTGKVNLHGVTV